MISIPIPLQAPLEKANVHFVMPGKAGEEFAAECPGTVAAPAAAAGNLCVYAQGILGSAEFVTFGFSWTSGVLARFNVKAEEKGGNGADGFGTWAVTAQ